MKKITFEDVRVPLDVMPEYKDTYRENFLAATRGTGRLMLYACDQKFEHLNADFYGEGIDESDADPEHLFKIGAKGCIGVLAAQRGLILVDTKYEFGKHNGEIYLMDEIHTPDSSRYFYSEGYQERFEAGEPQKQLSKEFVREWLMDNGFQGKAGQQVPEMTDEIVAGISNRYIELYEHITGETFNKEAAESEEALRARIQKNVTDYLTK